MADPGSGGPEPLHLAGISFTSDRGEDYAIGLSLSVSIGMTRQDGDPDGW